MGKNHAGANADGLTEESAVRGAPTLEDFGISAPSAPDEEVVEDQESEATEEIEQSEDAEQTEEGEVLSQELDLDQLSGEEKISYLNELYSKLDDEARREWLSNRDGRVGSDMGKMRKRASEAEERAEIAEKKIRELQGKVTGATSEFSSITDESDLDKVQESIKLEIEYFDEWIGGDDNTWEDPKTGQEFSRKQINEYLKSQRKKLDDVDNQRKRIKEISKAREKLKSTEEKLEEQYTWLKEKSGSNYEAYEKMIKDPKWSLVVDLIPELASELPKVLATYAAADAPAPKSKLKLKGKRVPSGDFGSSAQAPRKAPKVGQSLERLRNGTATMRDQLAMFS